MKAELVSIGTEITTGQNLDTNCQWLSRRLAEMGIPVGFHTTVADDFADNVEVFRIASRRARLVISTGGLGPTLDDLTREVVAEVAGVDLVEDADSLRQIEEMFARRNRVMPERNRVQAMFPRGAEVVPNEKGTAPGIWMPVGDSVVVCLPGVPSEMFHMFETQVRPRLEKLGLRGGVQIQRKINTFGSGESGVEEKLKDITARGRVPEVGITASDAVVSLRIIARGSTHEEALALASPVEATIRERLGDWVFGTDDEELQNAVFRLLAARKMTLSTAESVTGGLVAHRMVTVPGASEWFVGGVVAYASRVKVSELGVSAEVIAKHTAESEEVVAAMASGCRAKFGTDLAVATVGLAGPAVADDDRPVGMVHVALASASGLVVQSFNWMGTRTEIQSRCAKQALNLVRLHLLRTSGQ